jgi:hypothetical protein
VRTPELEPATPDAFGRAFTPAEIAADLDYFVAVLDELHPDPYRILARQDAAARCSAFRAGLDRPLSRVEVQPRLAELVAALGDGHTAVYLPWEEFWSDPAGGGQAFPLDVAWDGERLAVRRSAAVTADGALGPGAQLIDIGGRPAGELVRTFLARTSGETQAFRVAGVEQAFAVHLWLEGLKAPFAAHVASALDPAHVFGIELPGMPYASVARGDQPTGEPWRLERRADGVALLSLDTLAGDPGRFEDFLESVFGELDAMPPTALVIDLTRNGGGDSRLGDELLQYLSDRPWRQAARKEWKVSARSKRHLKSRLPSWIRWLPLQYLHPLGRQLWGTPEGQIAIFEFERTAPRDEPLRYRGPLAWLIGPSTFSSAMGLAAGARDCGRGLLVGQETGGVQNGTGEVVALRLPHTQLGVQISTAFFVRSDGDARARGGVQPDVAVAPVSGSLAEAALEAALPRILAPSP